MAILSSEGQRSSMLPQLLKAVKRGDVAATSSLITQSPILLSQGETDFDGGVWTALGLASRLGHLDVVRLLLSKGADKECQCRGYRGPDNSRRDACAFGSRFTPAHLAAMGKHYRVLKTLLEAGADAAAVDPSGMTPLYIAARQLSPECIQVLVEQGGGHVDVNLAAQNETPMMAALMELHQAKTQGVDPRALRAIHASVSAVIARLLEAGAEPNEGSVPDATGGAPHKFSIALLAALEYGLDELAVLLHLHGAQLPPGA